MIPERKRMFEAMNSDFFGYPVSFLKMTMVNMEPYTRIQVWKKKKKLNAMRDEMKMLSKAEITIINDAFRSLLVIPRF